VGIGGVWFGYFTWQLQQMPLLPVNDPRMEGVLNNAAGAWMIHTKRTPAMAPRRIAVTNTRCKHRRRTRISSLAFCSSGRDILFNLAALRYYAVVEQQPAPGSSFAGVRQLPVGPELQVNPRQDLLNVYAEQQRQLDNYSWEDRKAGTVRIPISQAMDLLLPKRDYRSYLPEP